MRHTKHLKKPKINLNILPSVLSDIEWLINLLTKIGTLAEFDTAREHAVSLTTSMAFCTQLLAFRLVRT